VSPARRIRPVLRRLAAPVLVAAAAYGAWSVLHGHGADLLRLVTRPGAVPWLCGAVLVSLAGLLLGALAWREVVACLGSELRPATGLRIFSAALLGKYLPGPLWSAAATVQLGRAAGIPAQRMVGAFLLNSVTVLITAALAGLLAAPRFLGVQAWWLTPALLLALACCWRPRLLVDVAAFAARIVRRPFPEQSVMPEASRMRRALLLELASWLVSGLHLWMIAMVLGASGAQVLPLCLGGFALATAAGALALFAPDGAGVRELVLLGALSTVMAVPQAAAAVVASRICCSATELLGAAVVLLATRRSGRAVPPIRKEEPVHDARNPVCTGG
jgi:uncharacterized membrane protein YbhN (UPF0104 family)